MTQSLHYVIDQLAGVLLALLGEVEIEHGGFELGMAQVALDDAQVDAGFEEMGGVGVAQRIIILLTNFLPRRSIIDIIPFYGTEVEVVRALRRFDEQSFVVKLPEGLQSPFLLGCSIRFIAVNFSNEITPRLRLGHYWNWRN